MAFGELAHKIFLSCSPFHMNVAAAGARSRDWSAVVDASLFLLFDTPSRVAMSSQRGQPQTSLPFSFESLFVCSYEFTTSCRKRGKKNVQPMGSPYSLSLASRLRLAAPAQER